MARYALFALAALLACGATSASRELLQSCPIKACSGECALKQLRGQSTRLWTCKTCATGYVRSNDGRACVCPPGKYETAVGATTGTCTQCPAGSFCVGGAKSLVDDGTKTSANRGPIASCDTTPAKLEEIAAGKRQLAPATVGLNSPLGARKIAQCYTQPGYYMASVGDSSAQKAMECGDNTYNAGGNRAKSCTACPGGLFTQGGPANKAKKAHCLVPPGSFWNTRASKPLKQCEKGSFRAGYTAAFADSVCDKCADGVTTAAAGSLAEAACDSLRKGYAHVTGEAPITETAECAIGFYAAERTRTVGPLACSACPTGETTQYMGSDASGDCIANAAVDDAAVTCAADGAGYGFSRIDRTNKPRQQFTVSETGKVTSIDVFIWGPESGAATAADYTLTILDAAGNALSPAAVSGTSNAAKTACADPENIDACDGDFRSFTFAGGVALAAGTTYSWQLTCADGGTCGFYGYCTDADVIPGLAYEGATVMTQDNNFQVTIVPDAPALKRV